MGIRSKRMNFCAEWAKDRKCSWSGTSWGIRQALSQRFEIHDVELAHTSSALSYEYRLRNRLGRKDFDLGKMRFQQRQYEREGYDATNLFFQFSEVPDVCDGERHYIYQDLPVEWVWRCHCDDPQTFKYSAYEGITKRAMKARLSQQRRFYELCAGVFTMGAWVADYLVDVCGLPQAKVHHVGGGINSLGLPEASVRQGNTFLYAGRDFARKGGDLVVRAFSRLHDSRPGLRLVIAGPRDNPAPGVAGVEFVGDVDNKRLGELMTSSDVFVMPSRFEAYGLVFPEAKVAGLPCVGRDRFEMPHFIEDGHDGRLIHSDDVDELAGAMLDCLESPSIRANALAEADSARDEFSWNAVAERIERVIEEDGADAAWA